MFYCFARSDIASKNAPATFRTKRYSTPLFARSDIGHSHNSCDFQNYVGKEKAAYRPLERARGLFIVYSK